ncbi:MAG: RNA polymerase sigma factor [Deltaproteobacteria bacterium]
MEDFLLAYKDKFFRYALRLTEDVNDAEDIMQELAIKIWETGEDFKKIENKEAWCMSVTRNMSIDKIRNNKKRAYEGLDVVPDAGNIDSSRPDDELVSKDMIGRIKKLISSLPENYKTVIHLREIEEMSYKEIAEIMQTDIQNVKVFLFRARKMLQQLVTDAKIEYQ